MSTTCLVFFFFVLIAKLDIVFESLVFVGSLTSVNSSNLCYGVDNTRP